VCRFLQQSRDEIVKHLHEDRDESGKKVEKLEVLGKNKVKY